MSDRSVEGMHFLLQNRVDEKYLHFGTNIYDVK